MLIEIFTKGARIARSSYGVSVSKATSVKVNKRKQLYYSTWWVLRNIRSFLNLRDHTSIVCKYPAHKNCYEFVKVECVVPVANTSASEPSLSAVLQQAAPEVSEILNIHPLRSLNWWLAWSKQKRRRTRFQCHKRITRVQRLRHNFQSTLYSLCFYSFVRSPPLCLSRDVHSRKHKKTNRLASSDRLSMLHRVRNHFTSFHCDDLAHC